MKLTKYLRKQGYDLIDGPVRNHKELQLWLKTPGDVVELYHDKIAYAFKSKIKLKSIKNDALNVNSSKKNEYGFNVGMTILGENLKSMGMGNLDLSSSLKGGKKVSISYDNSICKEVPIGGIQNYLASSDFTHPNPTLLKNANQDRILVVSGVLYAKNLVVDIETDFNLDTALETELNKVGNGKLDFSIKGSQKLKMVSKGNTYFPIAVKANRIDYDKGIFVNTKLVTDNRKFF